MITLKISGRKTVKTLKKEFKTAFDATLRIFIDMDIAKDTATLASVRKSSNKSGEIMLRGNMLVSNFEKIMIEDFGIKIQVTDCILHIIFLYLNVNFIHQMNYK